MPTEDCGVCGSPVGLANATHLLVNPSDADEVTDMYVCAACFEGELEPLLGEESEPAETAENV